MRVRIKGNNSIHGSIRVPKSKSLLHRAIIAASLAKGRSIIRGISMSNDILATIKGMEALGSKIIRHEDYLEIYGSEVKRKESVINAFESGSTLRFLIPIALLSPLPITFIGSEGLAKRPLEPYLNIFMKMGIGFDADYGSSLPLSLENKLKSGEYEIRGDISSQFITGLLFSLPLLEGNSKLIITSKLESRGYVDLTIDVLKSFGIEIINNNYESFYIRGGQSYRACEYVVEGDYSQAAFYLCMNALGANITLLDMKEDSHQGDKKILKDLEAMGSKIIFKDNTLTNTKITKSAIIDLANSPDLGPALAALMASSFGGRLINARRLRLKECDRIEAMECELNKLGNVVKSTIDSMTIDNTSVSSVVFSSHNDHRIAMALTILSLVADKEIIIDDSEAINKSYPDFWEDFKSLGGNLIYE